MDRIDPYRLDSDAKCLSHLDQADRLERGEVLNKGLLPNGLVEPLDVVVEVDIQEELGPDLLEVLEAGAVAGVVKVLNDQADRGRELQELLEGGVVDDLGLDLLAVKVGEGAEAAVGANVRRGDDVVEGDIDFKGNVDEHAGSLLVWPFF